MAGPALAGHVRRSVGTVHGDLPEVLALLHTSGRRWRTLRAEGEEWRDERVSHLAFARLRRPGRVFTVRGSPGPADRDPRWRLWIRRPSHARVEFGGAHQARFVQIQDGVRRWISAPHGPARVDERPGHADLQLGPLDVLVDTPALPAVLDLDVAGRSRILGRDTFTVRGRSRDGDVRPGPGPSPPFLRVADEVRMDVDAERGVVLRLEAVLEGQPFHRLEMTEVAFDEELDDDVFVFPAEEAPVPLRPGERSPPPGRPRRPPAPPHHPGPPQHILGANSGVEAVLARTPSVVVAVDRVVGYPTGFEIHLTVRTSDEQIHGTVEPGHPRSWGGAFAFPGESLTFGVTFADGRSASAGNFGDLPPARGLTLVPVSGSGTGGRFDQRFWVEPLPPPGPLRLAVAWPIRGVAETGVDVPADAILEAAAGAAPLWGGPAY